MSKLPTFDAIGSAQDHLFNLNTCWEGEHQLDNLAKWTQFKGTL